MEKINHIQLQLKESVFDAAGHAVSEGAKKYLNIETGAVRIGKIFSVLYDLNEDQINQFANEALRDAVIHDVYINNLYQNTKYNSHAIVSKLPGVTDDEGTSAQKALCDLLNIDMDTETQRIFTHEIYYFEKALTDETLQKIAEDLLGNNLINHFQYGHFNGKLNYVPTVHVTPEKSADTVNIFIDDEALLNLSRRMLLSLDLKEMKTIQAYYKDQNIQKQRRDEGLPELPTDCELEVLAQTWSEHCKHKEFNAIIHYKDLDSGKEKTIDSLFNTYIKKATSEIQSRLEESGNNWLLKVFSDNAGVVKIDDERVFIWKVETHNSPSALDPYGGALTGIVGVNRDPLGTGIGGGRFLFNTNVLCFGSPYYSGKLLKGQLHPRRIMAGVVKGIEDGGNKSGIPTVNGSIIFDERYSGKPLVYCGTGAVMPAHYKGRKSWEKEIHAGDRIIMAGGRVGKDGIHGATFSSAEIDEHSPRSAVQIGSPITQKLMSDFMEKASHEGLIKCSTDNGAGGLSSSVGELARISGGAIVRLERVPLKYSGLKPWEIFVSESQERMTFVVKPKHVEQLFAMAKEYEVEVTDIGEFTNSGVLDVRYAGKKVAYLSLKFLHDAVPKKTMEAEWKAPKRNEPKLPDINDYNEILLKLMGSLNICSKESVIRRYDHEVKGKTVVKPLMGPAGFAPQDAAVMRLDFDSYAGVAISNGIIPRYGDIDAYQMSAGAFDEAIRQIIAIGGKLPDTQNPGNRFWSVNDNFCVPDSAYNERTNPDGKYKLAQLVRMCDALYESAIFFNIPMTSGKDSMKNDFVGDGVKISVPPTILYSVVAKIEDIRETVTAEFKKEDDLIYQIGKTYNELGGSEFYHLFDEIGANVPIVRRDDAIRIYQKIMQANDRKLIRSCHDLSDGGLAVALAESAFGGNFGIEVDMTNDALDVNTTLFSESHSRFIVSISPRHKDDFEELFGNDCTFLGTVTSKPDFRMHWAGKEIVNLPVQKLLTAWRGGLQF